METSQDTLSLLRDFLHTRAKVDPAKVTREALLEQLEVDSLMLLDLLFEFEEKYGVSIPDDIPAPKSVGDLLDLFEKFKTGKTA